MFSSLIFENDFFSGKFLQQQQHMHPICPDLLVRKELNCPDPLVWNEPNWTTNQLSVERSLICTSLNYFPKGEIYFWLIIFWLL